MLKSNMADTWLCSDVVRDRLKALGSPGFYVKAMMRNSWVYYSVIIFYVFM